MTTSPRPPAASTLVLPAPQPSAPKLSAPGVRPDLESRADLDGLLVAFYTVAMTDELLGPVFVDAAHLDLRKHLPRIGAFWEQTLLGTGRYTGRPMDAHRRLHASAPLTPAMFARWLELWIAALDAAHSGPTAERAKAVAWRIAGAMQRQLAGGRALLQIDVPRPIASDRARPGTATVPAATPTVAGTHRRPLDHMEDVRG